MQKGRRGRTMIWHRLSIVTAAATLILHILSTASGDNSDRYEINITKERLSRRTSTSARNVDMRVEFEVEEGLPAGTFVGRIPTRPGYTYRFNENVDKFVLNGTTGEIRTSKEIDRESLTNDKFDLVVLSSQPTYPIEVRIAVKDINDHAPVFPEPEISVSFPESASAGTRVFLDTAEDPDSEENGVTTDYKICDGNDDEHFRLVVTTNPSGEAPFLHLETTGKLDRETKPFYKLNISASDGASPAKSGFVIVNVSVNDVNDFQPVFSHSQYSVSLNESVPPGTFVLQVTATDNDEGLNAKITYYLSETENQFQIDPENGVITTSQQLNCQQNCPQGQGQRLNCPKSCVFTVFARDHGIPRQDGRTYVTVNLIESNHAPVIKFRYFPPTAKTASVLETATNGSVVSAISVVDLDEGTNGETTVEIVSGNELNHFRLESTPSFQLIRTNAQLDREKMPVYNLTITAIDHGVPPCSSTAYLIIEVNDNKDQEISFAKTEYSAVLRETVPVGSYVASITATDNDHPQTQSFSSSKANPQVIYSIVSGNEKLWFAIDPNTGLLTTRAPLDREQQGTIRLKISARDGGPYPKWAHAQIKITILDENDEKPEFPTPLVHVTLPEDSSPGTLISTLSATDHDQGTNGSVIYSISPLTNLRHPGMFHIDSSTGKLTSTARFDRETRESYDIQVIAKDQGTPPLSSTATVQLKITDVNDNQPKFYPLEYFITVTEDSSVGQSIGQVFAYDPDEGVNGLIRYKLEPPQTPFFSVDEKTGKIILKSSLRGIKTKQFHIQISAMGKDGKKSEENEATVEVLVEGGGGSSNHLKCVRDTYSFTITEDFGTSGSSSSGASSSLTEHRSIGKIEVDTRTPTTTSMSSGAMRFNIIDGDPQGIFSVEGHESSALIKAVKHIDREVEMEYTLKILVRRGLSHGTCFVGVKVLDLNDNSPGYWDLSELSTRISANAPIEQQVMIVKATDKDDGRNSQIIYSLSRNPDKIFRINSTTGIISLEKSLRQTDLTHVDLEVTAKDNGTQPLFSKQAVHIEIQAVNDHTPVFEHSSYETSLAEGTPVNSRFYHLQATDLDTGSNAQLSFEILEGNGADKFGVFPDGALYVKSRLDREDQDYYSLVIRVTDQGAPPRSSLTSVVIHVSDDNDLAPKFTNSTFSFSIPENEAVGTYVGKITATDGDIGRNAQLTYSIVSPHQQHNLDFTIDPKNGFIKTQKSFDREKLLQSTGQSFIHLDVLVQDNGLIRLKDKASVTVEITDVNDEVPKFLKSSYTAQISEDAQVGSQVIRVTASDIDEDLNGDVIYYIKEGNEGDAFKVDMTTGQVSLEKELDRETKDKYSLQIVAQDMAEKGKLSSSAAVLIDVLDVNDCTPSFMQNFTKLSKTGSLNQTDSIVNSAASLTVNEITPVSTVLAKFSAVDCDIGLNQQILFSITGGNRHDTFLMNQQTGALLLNKALDFEKYTSYALNISVSDGGSPKLSSFITFSVKVSDFNDNPPIFPSTSIVRQIQEGIPLKTTIVTVSAEDPDSGVNGQVKYSIKEQDPPGNHFGIDADLGVIHVARDIDREFADTFRLTVIAVDQAVPESQRLSSEKLVTVIVEDINDNEPKFVCMNAAVLHKSWPPFTEITKVLATDIDSESNGAVTYDLVSGDSGLFKLDRNTGSLKLTRSLANEMMIQPRYQLTVRATDEAIQSQRKSSELYLMILSVSSDDKDGNSGGGAHLTFDQAMYSGSIYENEPIGTSILTVSASLAQDKLLQDSNGAATRTTSGVGGDASASSSTSVEYYITNITSPDGALQHRLFDMDVKRGILSMAVLLDREMGVSDFQVEIYAILVSAQGLTTASTKVRIQILDKNDSPPIWPSTKPTKITVSENAHVGQQIAILEATDPDTIGSITYSIVDSPNGDVGAQDKFEVDPNTGVLRIIDTLDREKQEEWTFVVRASDGVQHTDGNVIIMVTDTNDNPPTWALAAYSFDIAEDVVPGTAVGKLEAHDLDKGVNGHVIYSVLSDWGDDVFSLNPDSGLFTLTSTLDYEDVQHYIFVVQAHDTGVPSLSSTTTVYLNVLDLNDNAPIFDPLSYSKEIFENIAEGSSVLTVSATDADSGPNGQIEYVISSGNEDDVFAINDNGTIFTAKQLDRETKPTYQLIITAKDKADVDPLFSSVQVNIVLKDVNDESPSFVSSNETTVMENSQLNSVIHTVKAVDGDEGRNGYVEYALNNEKGTFSLGAVDGLLRVVGNIDRELRSNYTLKITAKDRGDPSKMANQLLFVKVQDNNDHDPLFDSRQYSAAVPENASVGMSVLQVSATDMDEGLNSQIRYSIVTGDPNRDFMIGEDTGVLRLAKNLNYERKRSYTLTIQAEDSGEMVRYDTATVTVSVTDINDRAPVFLNSPYLAHVRENVRKVPATVLYVEAFDADSPSNNNYQLRYLLKDGDKDSFRVNATTGEITVHRALDREKQSEYLLTVIAMDTGTPRLTGTGMVKVLISDDNDCNPKFEQDHYEFSVFENSPQGTSVAKVVATDLDEGLNALISYKILSDSESYPFTIDSQTGEIFTNGVIDRELRDSYRFRVSATDLSPISQLSSTSTITVVINDQNDNAPKFHMPSYSVKIPDNIVSGSYIVGVSATDADFGLNSKLRYFMTGADADKFQINESTGVIKSLRHLNKSGKTQLNVEVHAIDSAPKEPLSSSVNVQVNLANHMRFPQIKSQVNTFAFKENVTSGHVVTSLHGLPAPSIPPSRQGRHFSYYVGGGNLANAFIVDQHSGQVKVSKSGLDYETARQYELWVEVSDDEAPDFRSAIPLYINVTDVNDNQPIFSEKIYNLSIPEEEPGPKLITTLVATDKDTGRNGEMRYFLTPQSEQRYGSIFKIDPDSGKTYAKVKLDREEVSQYIFDVQAIDKGLPPKTGTATVIVNVEDLNDNPMKFTRLFSVNVTENVPVGTFVIQVTSVDKDIGENANCSYSLTENAQGKFKIEPFSGNVTVSGPLDRESQDEYLLKVSAVDGSWRAETLLTITIEDVNDQAPEFEYSYYNFNIPEAQQPVTFIGQVTAVDRDKRGPNSVVSYSLKQPSELFSVDPISGEIFSKRSLKYINSWRKFSPENEHTIWVLATDNGKPPMSSECSITINVINGNNHPPSFVNKPYFSPVLENSTVGQKILKVEAVDSLDFGVNSDLEYLKISGNGTEYFEIDKNSGWMYLTKPLKNKVHSQYNVQVRVTDKGIPPQSDDTQVLFVVTSTNLHSPVFSALSYRVIVPENELLGTVIVTVQATDQDEGPNGQVLYNITKGNEPQGWFSIDPETGAVKINKSLDYDTSQEYHLIITASDRGYHGKSSEAELTVILTDVNDNPPTFDKPLYDAFIKENSPLGQKVFQLNATDKDSPKNGVIRYAIVGGSGKHAFKVDPISGLIKSVKTFDYEYRQEYMLDILASNPPESSNLLGSTKVIVHVEGVNEFYPKFVQPVFHFAVSESAVVGSQIGSVQATDEDGGEDGQVYYLFVGSSNDRGFSINPTTGAITVSRRLDRESQSRVVLTVIAKNRGPIRGNDTDEAQVVITVQDGNDPPVFEKETYEAKISEDAAVGWKVIGVKATDIDVRPSNNRFTYEILDGNDNKTFKIDPIAGVIYTAEILDRESVPSYSLTVGAIDTGVPPQTGTTIVKIILLDVNDNGPTLHNSSRQGTILENEPANSRVMTLHAHDLDLSPNGEPFTYALIGGPDAAKFRVDSKTGHVTTTDSFDRESTPELQILIEITDNGKPARKTKEHVKILVGDKNDCPSEARNAQIILYTFKNMIAEGEKVASVEPLDPDVIGQYTCRLESSRDIFRIPTSCDIHLNKIPNYKRHSVKILGDDGRHPEVASTMQFEFISIDNSTLNNSIIIRAFGVAPTKILEKSYLKLLQFWRQIFNRGEPQIYGLLPHQNATDIILAVKGTDQQYLSKDQIMTTLITHKGHVEILLDASVIINYDVCSTQNVCQNGASCTQYLQLQTVSQQISDSSLLILSSPTIDLNFSCKCPSGFTGNNCQLRKEPCQPNPCDRGVSCIKQGYDFACACPPNREGKRCERERSSACQSNPCRNGGSCQENQQSGGYFCLCRPGFFGNICQTASNACKPNPCLNGGECQSPSVGPSSAFPRCKCQKHFYGRYCEKSAFGFSLGSYMSFSPLDSNTNDISITFSTNQRNALLVYDFGEQIGGRSDFVAIQLIEGKASFSYGGARTAITSIAVNKLVSDGKWHKITATRNSRVISLTVSSCEESGEICQECRPGDSSCYANVVGPTGTLNFNGQHLLIAGVKNVEVMLERPGQIQTDDFVGCIHSVAVNGRHLNMSSPIESRAVTENCQRTENICQFSSHALQSSPFSSSFHPNHNNNNNNNKCGGGLSECIDLWDRYMCRCGEENVLTPNCNEAFTPFSFQLGAFIEFRPSEMYTRSQILHGIYSENDESRIKREIGSSSKKSLMFSFRTIQPDAVLMYAASGKDFTLIELENGDLKFTSQNGASKQITMLIEDPSLVDGSWHSIRLISHHRTLQVYLDGKLRGDELDTATAHDFLDPYLIVLTLGGMRDDFVPSNKISHGFTGCMANFTIRDQLLPFNGSGLLFDEVLYHGKVSRGCSNAIAGAATAPDPLSIGVTLVIVFFVVLLVAILVSFVIFRLKRREKNPLPSMITSTTKPTPPGPGSGDVVRSHILEGDAEAIRNLVRNSKKLGGGTNNQGYHKPDIIDRTTSNMSNPSVNSSPINNGGMVTSAGISLDPELAEMPECYDLENASSIAPSDIDIVYHYKGFRDNLGGGGGGGGGGGRTKSSPFRHNHHFPGSRQSPGIRQSPISNVLKSTPLARLSPSSELSQQTTPRILTLQDISGKPLQSALLATTHQKDAMSQSERSLNISQSSSRSSMVNASSQGTTKKRKKCVGGGGGDGGGGNNIGSIGLTAEEIERLNNSRHKNNSSLVSTLDAVSSSEEESGGHGHGHHHQNSRRKQNKINNLSNHPNHQRSGGVIGGSGVGGGGGGHVGGRGAQDTSSDEDESGNDSFTCSEFEYDNDKRNNFRGPPPHHSHPHQQMFPPKRSDRVGVGVDAGDQDESFRGSLSTLVASDDDLAYINSYSKSGSNPNGGPSSMGWDYLLNWGPNFENLVGVFKDIAELPDEQGNPPHPVHHQQGPPPPIPKIGTPIGQSGQGSSGGVGGNPNNSIGNSNLVGQSSRSSRYPTPRPNEQYV